MLPGFDAKKAAHVAAYFALKSGGSINVLKLSKLLYLAERESMRLYGEPMFYDRLVSMDHGPVTSITLNLINGDTQSPMWSEVIAPRRNYSVKARTGTVVERLDQLSKADISILDGLWRRFKSFDQYRLRDWTHNNCPEWKDPNGSSVSIRG